MLTEKDKQFLKARKKLIKLAFPLVYFLFFVWLVIYVFMAVYNPDLVFFDEKIRPKDQPDTVFFNLFMVVLLVFFSFIVIAMKNEINYIRIIEKLDKESPQEKGT